MEFSARLIDLIRIYRQLSRVWEKLRMFVKILKCLHYNWINFTDACYLELGKLFYCRSALRARNFYEAETSRSIARYFRQLSIYDWPFKPLKCVEKFRENLSRFQFKAFNVIRENYLAQMWTRKVGHHPFSRFKCIFLIKNSIKIWSDFT